ncbi:MAG TPA: double zinc ribbon domain-containing protein [Actinomycetota bacterium]
MLDLLFASRCASCGAYGPALCRACAAAAGVIFAPVCERCGRPTEEPVPACGDCPPPNLTRARAPFLYQGPVADAIRALKFRGWGWLAGSLGGAMAHALGPDRADVITWVPLTRRRRAARGFDQAQLLARAVARRLDLPWSRLLHRSRHTGSQARRGGRERRTALEGTFWARSPVPGSILLVDDVLTTGATAAACAAALREAGAGRVILLTAARSLGTGVPARCFGGYNRTGPSPGSVVARGDDPR